MSRPKATPNKNNNGTKIEKKREVNSHCSLDEQIAETQDTMKSEVCPLSSLVNDVELNPQLSSVRDTILEDNSLIKPIINHINNIKISLKIKYLLFSYWYE